MSASQAPPSTSVPAVTTPPAAGDPSMEDILASIRRILSEDESPAGATSALTEPAPGSEGNADDDVLALDPAMMVTETAPEPVIPVPVAPPLAPSFVAEFEDENLVAPAAAAAAASSVESLMRTLAADRNVAPDRSMLIHSGGPTLEDIVRDELRPLLKQWLDTNLPLMVERLVRAEIDRVVGGRAVP